MQLHTRGVAPSGPRARAGCGSQQDRCRGPSLIAAPPLSGRCPRRVTLVPSNNTQHHRGATTRTQYWAREESFATANTPVGVAEKAEEILLPLPRYSESPVDDPQLHNPLLRAQRLSTAWFGVILELEGVVIQGSEEEHVQAWLQTAAEYGYKRPFGQQLRRIKGVRDEVIVSRVFGWTHNPTIARQVAQRKAELYEHLMGGRPPAAMLESHPFLETLKKNGIPVALATPLPDNKVVDTLQRLNLRPYFDAVVTADDSGSAETEFYYAYAAQKIGRPPIRCVVVGESNTSVEAAHELGMKCIIVTGNNPVYDFGSADLVVRNLSQLSFMNLRKLFGNEDLVEPRNVDESDTDDGAGLSYSIGADDEFDDFEDDHKW